MRTSTSSTTTNTNNTIYKLSLSIPSATNFRAHFWALRRLEIKFLRSFYFNAVSFSAKLAHHSEMWFPRYWELYLEHTHSIIDISNWIFSFVFFTCRFRQFQFTNPPQTEHNVKCFRVEEQQSNIHYNHCHNFVFPCIFRNRIEVFINMAELANKIWLVMLKCFLRLSKSQNNNNYYLSFSTTFPSGSMMAWRLGSIRPRGAAYRTHRMWHTILFCDIVKVSYDFNRCYYRQYMAIALILIEIYTFHSHSARINVCRRLPCSLSLSLVFSPPATTSPNVICVQPDLFSFNGTP